MTVCLIYRGVLDSPESAACLPVDRAGFGEFGSTRGKQKQTGNQQQQTLHDLLRQVSGCPLLEGEYKRL